MTRASLLLYRLTFSSLALTIGCGSTEGPAAPESRSSETVTFTRDIAPIVFEHCAGCHRPGESGPFGLLDYDDVKKHAKQIAEVTASRYMPPWLPEAGYGEFKGARGLGDDQIETIRRWLAGGAIEA